ncbi:hypothetical protein HaLaN_12858 [Haematococcus lacustris]|uniref:Secreted protein n=1 Tax=Haematococcus lacustris TaxID=44745 RepID=A0A699ZB35_HAELA|nr:hypothetical protein HaLaN_12858 [Haematococcus lacustris]
MCKHAGAFALATTCVMHATTCIPHWLGLQAPFPGNCNVQLYSLPIPPHRTISWRNTIWHNMAHGCHSLTRLHEQAPSIT